MWWVFFLAVLFFFFFNIFQLTDFILAKQTKVACCNKKYQFACIELIHLPMNTWNMMSYWGQLRRRGDFLVFQLFLVNSRAVTAVLVQEIQDPLNLENSLT